MAPKLTTIFLSIFLGITAFVPQTLADGFSGFCETSRDCEEGFKCKDNQCEPKARSCNDDFDCPRKQICKRGQCKKSRWCENDYDCPRNGQCIRNQCQSTRYCEIDEECPIGTICHNQRCQPRRGGCYDDYDCPVGTICNNGQCQRDRFGCYDDYDCPIGTICNNGQCQREECRIGDYQTEACGLNDRGTRTRHCQSGRYPAWPDCPDPDVCKDGAERTQACGLNGRGSQKFQCIEGQWSGPSICQDPDICQDGASRLESCSTSQGTFQGHRMAFCAEGAWDAPTQCISRQCTYKISPPQLSESFVIGTATAAPYKPQLTVEVANDTSQEWILTPVTHETGVFFRILNQKLEMNGVLKALDTQSRRPYDLWMGARDKMYSGQLWTLKPDPSGLYRMSNAYLGPAHSFATKMYQGHYYLYMDNPGNQHSYQLWQVRPQGPCEEP